MDFFFAFLGLIWLTYRLGKEDGKWGHFTFLMIIILIAVIYTALS